MPAPAIDRALLDLITTLTEAELTDVVAAMSEDQARALLSTLAGEEEHPPASPAEQAALVDEAFRLRDHLAYLSAAIAQAVTDVENGQNRRLIIEMPPRSGKTTMSTLHAPAWIMRRHPDWPIALTSHDGGLATDWGRQIRRWVEEGKVGSVALAKDAGAVSRWETTAGGKLLSISLRESFTGRGAKVLVIDDPHKDNVEAQSAKLRGNVWDWWLSVAQTRLEPPYLVIVVMTRWHEDDLVGRLLSKDYPGNPGDWEVIRLPALAEDHDIMGRTPGEPLLSPLVIEDADAARMRWADQRQSVGEYVWAAMFQQRPAPAKGAIFDTGWWRYWTTDPSKVTDDGTVVLLDPTTDLDRADKWLDSWDCAFKATDDTDYVVGQRWCRRGPNRFLLAQKRGRWTFTQTVAQMEDWADPFSRYGRWVHMRLIEEKANGSAIIDTLKERVSGMKPINPQRGKEARARAITPECESGHVYLPHPGDPGNEWVNELLSELRNFPFDTHDDQVDGLTQALEELHDPGRGHITNPADAALLIPQGRIDAAHTERRRVGGPAITTRSIPRGPGGR
jgi:predicted phage terminase large subunit-like protein